LSALPVDLLEPVDLAGGVDRLELSVGQVSAMAGISRTQLDYWTKRARIPTRGKTQRRYDSDAFRLVLLIKQGKDKGLGLRAAIEAAGRFQGSSTST